MSLILEASWSRFEPNWGLSKQDPPRGIPRAGDVEPKGATEPRPAGLEHVMFMYMFICLCICLYVYVYVYMSMFMFICLYVYVYDDVLCKGSVYCFFRVPWVSDPKSVAGFNFDWLNF